MLNDFFECNSISLEVIEAHEDNKLCMGRVAALKTTRSEMRSQYEGEPDADIIIQMTVYYCGLLVGYVDESAKKRLSKLTEESLVEVFGKEDGKTVHDVLNELLVIEPSPKPEKKKVKIPADHRWEQGDVYLYRPKTSSKTGILDGKSAILVCNQAKIPDESKHKKIIYIMLCKEDKLNMPLNNLLRECVFIPASTVDHIYKHIITDNASDYPSERISFLGNTDNIPVPDYEFEPSTYLYYKFLAWKFMDNWLELIYGKMLELE